MAARKCPICGEKTVNGKCYSCGFVFPDEEKLAAEYDLDPSNVLFGEAAEEAAPTMEKLDTNAMPSIDAPRTSLLSYPEIKARPAVPQKPVRNNVAPKPQPQPQQQPPMQVYQPVDPLTYFVKTVVNFVTAHWWQFLITLLTPTAGILFAVYYFIKFSYGSRAFSDIALGIIFFIAGMLLIASGTDLMGLDYWLREILLELFGG